MSEKELEDEFVELLTGLNYNKNDAIKDLVSLENNFKSKLEKRNGVNLSEAEFKRVLDTIINSNVFEASKTLRESFEITRDDDTKLPLRLMAENWCANDFEVITQPKLNTKNSHHKYDVILLFNGLPLVQIELKNGANKVSAYNAIEQIKNYKKAEGTPYRSTLMCFVQIFIVSNGSNTLYFANNNTLGGDLKKATMPVYKWADDKNKKIVNLESFARAALERCNLARMIERYIVLKEETKELVLMRPYQIYAVQKILEHIKDEDENGYIWHTTGSGKTLTSFKTATLLKQKNIIDREIYKCMFIVDRKDLDTQTVKEFNKFQEGSVETNENSQELIRKMLSENIKNKVIVTTLQKFNSILTKRAEELKGIKDKHFIFIFDECHRSQFGDTNKKIREFFKNHRMYGFTGTPIFEDNATKSIGKIIENGKKEKYTTKTIFNKELHSYRIANAIDDGNVLAFNIQYNEQEEKAGKEKVVDYILKHHHRKTEGREFNSLFATKSINDAIEYYEIFQKKIKEQNQDQSQKLEVRCLFSPPQLAKKEGLDNETENEEYEKSTEEEKKYKEKKLLKIMQDFESSYTSTNNQFYSYSGALQETIKNHNKNMAKNKRNSADDSNKKEKIADITIVVDMLLTGFDSHYTNTLYVDKNLKHHGLIQAFSRTNRVIYSSDNKPHGNIVCFSTTKKDVDEAIEMFSKPHSENTKWQVKKFEDLKKETIKAIEDLYKTANSPEAAANLQGQEARKEFLQAFREANNLYNTIIQYDEYDKNNEAKEEIETELKFNEENRTAYMNMYQNIKEEYFKTIRKEAEENQESQKTPEETEAEFELTMSKEYIIDYDYIIKLIREHIEKPEERTIEEILQIISADEHFRGNKHLIESYINNLKEGDITTKKDLIDYIENKKKEALPSLIDDIKKIININEDISQDIKGIIKRIKNTNKLKQADDAVITIIEKSPEIKSLPQFDTKYKETKDKIYERIEKYFKEYENDKWQTMN